MLSIHSAQLDSLAVDPVSPEPGQLWFNIADQVIRMFTGSQVLTIPDGISTPATQVGQVLFSTDGSTFSAELPITNDFGWLANAEGISIVNG